MRGGISPKLVLTEKLTAKNNKILARYGIAVKPILDDSGEIQLCIPTVKAIVPPADSVIGDAIDLLNTVPAILPANSPCGWLGFLAEYTGNRMGKYAHPPRLGARP